MLVSLLFCLLAAAGLLAAIVARVAAPKDAIKGLARHKEHQFFWGNLLGSS
ncbi:hypothetical protein DIPPA_23582 [Diplonema papillatum]|nr:hypothetical protein DIPPA_23582 [Diplonema papillatum]